MSKNKALEDLKYYRSLCETLRDTALEFKYSYRLIVYADFVGFLDWMYENHPSAMYEDPEYYYLDDSLTDWTTFGNRYLRETNYVTTFDKNIPYIHVKVEDMLINLYNNLEDRLIRDTSDTTNGVEEIVNKVIDTIIKPKKTNKSLTKQEQLSIRADEITASRKLKLVQSLKKGNL